MGNPIHIAIIGGGPAGLMAADTIANSDWYQSSNVSITVYDAMPTPGRKLLMAGKSGLNLSHNEDHDLFISRYFGHNITPMLQAISDFPSQAVTQFFNNFGIETFVGSSGRIFPKMMKAAPFLRAWLKSLASKGVQLKTRHKLTAIDGSNLEFSTPAGIEKIDCTAVLLACGGISWPKLGSDGEWSKILRQHSIPLAPFKASNCGFLVNWSDFFKNKWAGEPVKSIRLSTGGMQNSGDFVISKYGIEGSAVYGVSSALHDNPILHVDLTPNKTLDQITAQLTAPRGKMSLANLLRKKLKIQGVKSDLIRECITKEEMQDPIKLAKTIKACPITTTGPRPIAEAISTSGGLPLDQLDEQWMIKKIPSVFAAGEMLDWDAPTGGYLLTACWATGRAAGHGMIKYLECQNHD